MPIKIPVNLPASAVLNSENIFVMDEERAYHQDIRPLYIVILNLMPTKIETETQLLRLLGNSPLQVEVELIHPASYTSKNTPDDHLIAFYETFGQIRHRKFDGMIITGAPVEHMEFEDVAYWEELREILEWTRSNVTSTLHICWGAQAGLYHHYGIGKHPLDRKMFGIFPHQVVEPRIKLLRGFDDVFMAPHSRHTGIRTEDLKLHPEICILAQSDEAGLYMAATRDGRQIYVTGHPEYDANTLNKEYLRDLGKGLPIQIPKNYFPDNDPQNPPLVQWRGHANLLYSNWLNYYVYQETPYDLAQIG
ncbi:MAG TPA: homoserine O-succinyltransferase [Clostridiales bacterium]|nr:homoserine O-succinyltransferase [Clostridiales bacterium]